MSLDAEIEKLIELEGKCRTCDGNGCYFRSRFDAKPTDCPYCDGKGIAITDFGKKVLEFVKKHTAPVESYE